MKKNYTLRDIAEIAGVSLKTVSRTINNEKGVKDSTREKVLKVIKETDYRLNMHAKMLSQNKSNQILVVSDIDNDIYPSHRTSLIVDSIISNAQKFGYKVILVNNLVELEKNFMGVIERGYYDGIIVLNSPLNNSLLGTIEKLGVPVIVSGKNDKFKYVGTDHEMGAYLATDYLLELGLRDIRLFVDNPLWPTHADKIEGFKRALSKHKLDFKEDFIITHQNTSKDIFKFIEKRVEEGTLFEGAIIQSDFLALGAIKAVNKYKLNCPEDIKIIGFGNTSLSEEVYPELTSVEQDFEKIGTVIVQKLLQMINGHSVSSYKIDTKLFIRNSTEKK
ncbi:LacI family DNA-binding transcriptional regulator [Oceanobacillus salinisoli]|uniref:LacI family DNA-binding transcriptional regulator n=1 Tax=Oceanobacillus salinisoli TaxID=2678611 RepID=UPI0012E1B153|nr:LacI family DNA-binding transcriptional regulator [Oceanobacillus salinisoli]